MQRNITVDQVKPGMHLFYEGQWQLVSRVITKMRPLDVMVVAGEVNHHFDELDIVSVRIPEPIDDPF